MADTMIEREKNGRGYGVFCVAEGLADHLPDSLRPKEKDSFGHTVLGNAEIGKIIASGVKESYKNKTGKEIKVLSKQIGYETRTAYPISFDVVLGSMLGYGSYKLFSEGKAGNMVSVENNFDVIGIPFSDLVDPKNLTTKVRIVPNDKDFYHLKNILAQ